MFLKAAENYVKRAYQKGLLQHKLDFKNNERAKHSDQRTLLYSRTIKYTQIIREHFDKKTWSLIGDQ